MHLKEELEQRGLLKQATHDELFDLYNTGGQTLYIGMDPTADSLHLGNFVGFMHALQYMKRGNKLIFIVGGATGMIGDPGGKNSERNFLDEKTLSHNVEMISKQAHSLVNNIKNLSGIECDIEVINNLDFYQGMSYIRFLRDIGKHITINSMMKKETVRKRIEDPEQSISYTEFSYMLMQGYDFLHLRKHHNCKLQIAGSDQWGNIVTGIELIRKLENEESYGATSPLVVDSTGKKFGKSEGNALWLSPEKNSPFTIYQYFMNTTDEDVSVYMKLFSLESLEDIEGIINEHQQDTSIRIGQQKLAYMVTQLIFGTESADHAVAITKLLFQDDNKMETLKTRNTKALEALHQATGGHTSKEPSLRVADLCTASGITSSNGEAKKAIKQGILYINEQKIDDVSYEISAKDSLEGLVLVRKGKKVWSSIRLPA